MERKKGRPKKVKTDLKVTKKRGRKPETDYFSSSAAKRAMKEISKAAPPIENCNILQLNVESDDIQDQGVYGTLIQNDNFKELQKLHNEDIVDSFLELGDSKTSLEELYNEKLQTRQELNTTMLEKIKEFHETGTEFQELPDTFTSEPISNTNYTPVGSSIQTNSSKIEDMNNEMSLVTVSELVDSEWKEHVNIKCWWCCHHFDCTPIGIPMKYQLSIDKFVVKGIFCGFPCMCAFVDNSKEYSAIKLKSLIKHMYNRLTGGSLSDTIIPALPKETLVDFGGELTIETYREMSRMKRVYRRIDYPLIMRNNVIHLSEIEGIKNNERKRNAGKDHKLTVNLSEPIVKHIQADTIDSILGIEYEN